MFRKIPLLLLIFVFSNVMAQEETPEIVPVDSLETYEIDLLAGPMRTAAYLAPNGEIFAHFEEEQVCIYTIEGEQQDCFPLPEMLTRLDLENVVWSPDSTKLAMHHDFFITLLEPDIWMLDVTEGEFTNLTEDNIPKFDITDDGTRDMLDILPQWSEDSSEILFIRYVRGEDAVVAALHTIQVESGEVEQIGAIEQVTGYSASSLSWGGDQLAYNIFLIDENNGTWISETDGSNPRRIESTPPEDAPRLVKFSPDGSSLLIYSTSMGQFRAPIEPEQSPVRVLNIEDGERTLIDPERLVWAAGWSPEGSALAYLVRDAQNPDNEGLYITSQAGEPGHLILQGRFLAPTPSSLQTLTWTENNRIMLSRSPERGIVIIELDQP